MQVIIRKWGPSLNRIMVDTTSELVAYQQVCWVLACSRSDATVPATDAADCSLHLSLCQGSASVIFSASPPYIRFVSADHLPSSFITVPQALTPSSPHISLSAAILLLITLCCDTASHPNIRRCAQLERPKPQQTLLLPLPPARVAACSDASPFCALTPQPFLNTNFHRKMTCGEAAPVNELCLLIGSSTR
jgi:hypothetical protein